MLSSENYWVLVDYPLSQKAVKDATNHQLEYEWWYADTVLQDAIEVSPLWVRTTNEHLNFKQEYHLSPAFTTYSNDEEFLQHVKSLCIMKDPTGKPFVIRFYEADYLAKWVAKLSEERLAELLGPIEEINWLFRGKEEKLLNPSPKNSSSQKEIAWFKLTEPEWKMLTSAFPPS
ncbi:DUF4123 domain-containing protein [Vibrio tubiashii]|uniref:DUF4123 domain-containing protein n=1 Tax=Vibrio tubiashii TaxID=29498 RepID=UPI001EFDAB3A|nr:DUF4123 domain-containing protein [Vibrio tubiashii]MCG9582335.1 DUF4123 domain-containing protein [Vibrio tubiashii]MCG9615926.1 DUF4123 domain-containing protein [Vibrio tubiashii]MCG9688578.1 DUF4123 domain-containing protein [Vibrio tubiashii]